MQAAKSKGRQRTNKAHFNSGHAAGDASGDGAGCAGGGVSAAGDADAGAGIERVV